MQLNFDYYYGNEAEQFSFYRIPKVLLSGIRFRTVSLDAKVLYGLLLDRMSLSVKNGWLDEGGRVYIIFTIADVMETLGCAEQKASKLLNELDSAKGVGLIERKRRGLGKPNVIYVKKFIDRAQTSPEPPIPSQSQIKNCENHKSGNVKIANQELRKSQTNNTYLNNTELSKTYPSIHLQRYETAAMETTDIYDSSGQDDGMDKTDSVPVTDRMELLDSYRELIRKNIDYDILLQRSPYDGERLEGFVELMAEVCSGSRGTIRVNRENIITEVVKSRFFKLDSGHIRYVMDCLDRTTTLVRNIRSYILSVLFNAPVTISQYYSSLVSNDMAYGFGGG